MVVVVDESEPSHDVILLEIALSSSTSRIWVVVKENYKFANGEDAYQKVCAYCHTINIAPKSIYIKMDDTAGIEARRDSIMQTVRSGSNAMPAFRKSEIDDATLKDLATKLANGTITFTEK